MHVDTQRIHFLTFGAGRPSWKRSSVRLIREASSSGMFASTNLITEEDLRTLVPDLVRDFHATLNADIRGFGFWIWKPAILRAFLDDVPEDEIVLYMDAGCSLNLQNPLATARFSEYVRIAAIHGAVAFQMLDQIEENWNKAETINEIVKLPTDEILKSGQIIAGIFLVKNCELIRNLLSTWSKLSVQDELRLVNDSFAPELQKHTFRAHRHDQSIWSLLYKEWGLPMLSDETYFFPNWRCAGFAFPFWATRKRSGLSCVSESLVCRLIRKADQTITDLALLQKAKNRLVKNVN